MRIFFKFITIAIYFFVIIFVMNRFFSHEKIGYYIITIALLAIGVLTIDFLFRKFLKH